MTLTPCRRCRRHVSSDASICPFCDAALDRGAPRQHAVGKWSRAAVFASALAAPACWRDAPPAHGPMSPSATGRVVGTVQAPASVGRSMVAAIDAKGTRIAFQVAPDGRYAIDLPPGTYYLEATPAPTTRPTEQVFGSDREQIVVEAGKTLQVRVLAITEFVPHPIAAPYGAPPRRARGV